MTQIQKSSNKYSSGFANRKTHDCIFTSSKLLARLQIKNSFYSEMSIEEAKPRLGHRILSVANIPNMSPTNFVSNIHHQHGLRPQMRFRATKFVVSHRRFNSWVNSVVLTTGEKLVGFNLISSIRF